MISSVDCFRLHLRAIVVIAAMGLDITTTVLLRSSFLRSRQITKSDLKISKSTPKDPIEYQYLQEK